MKRSVYNYAFLSLGLLTVLFLAADISGFKFESEKIDPADVKVEIAANDSADFYGKNWKLIKIEGQSVESKTAFIKFDEKETAAIGNAGCNNFSGKLAKTGNRLDLSGIAINVMYCQGNPVNEYQLMKTLDQINEFKIKDGKLFLMENKTVVLEFEETK